MFQALNLQTHEAVNLLQARWKSALLQDLRLLDDADLLACPGCRQPVRVRAGTLRRWHFAHKHLANCPFERESPLLLEMRACLYDWLVAQFGEACVAIEYPLSGAPRPVDACVSFAQSTHIPFLYWIFDTRLPPGERQALQEAIQASGFNAHYLFTATLLRPDPRLSHHLHLTTTEREFLQQTTFDAIQYTDRLSPGGTLHYLNTADEMLTTYRNLQLFHQPQMYAGFQLQHPWNAIQAHPENGELAHPGEMELLVRTQSAISRREHKIQRALAQLTRHPPVLTASAVEAAASEAGDSESPIPPAELQRPIEEPPLLNRPFQRTCACERCGQITADWVRYNGKTGLCFCRECADREPSGSIH